MVSNQIALHSVQLPLLITGNSNLELEGHVSFKFFCVSYVKLTTN